jgi:hypothetical protein
VLILNIRKNLQTGWGPLVSTRTFTPRVGTVQTMDAAACHRPPFSPPPYPRTRAPWRNPLPLLRPRVLASLSALAFAQFLATLHLCSPPRRRRQAIEEPRLKPLRPPSLCTIVALGQCPAMSDRPPRTAPERRRQALHPPSGVLHDWTSLVVLWSNHPVHKLRLTAKCLPGNSYSGCDSFPDPSLVSPPLRATPLWNRISGERSSLPMTKLSSSTPPPPGVL